MNKRTYGIVVAALALVGCEPEAKRTAALDAAAWESSEWISAADAKVADAAEKKAQRAADGTSWFVRTVANEAEVASATWMTTALGTYELYVNGRRTGSEALKPGFTHVKKTRRSFTYDVTPILKKGLGETNVFAAEVSAGWWRDQIVRYAGQKSAFRGVLEVTYADGTKKLYGTNVAEWRAGVGGPVTHAAIFDGEEYDARIKPLALGADFLKAPQKNGEFQGEILPSEGGEIVRRFDKILFPAEAYVWKDVDGADSAKRLHGRVRKLRDVKFGTLKDPLPEVVLEKGETLVVDFGQNAAAVPGFIFKADEGTVVTCLPAEMLNDRSGEYDRGNDGPGGSIYRANLRIPDRGMRCVYTFGEPGADNDGFSLYWPMHTFFGYRYLSITATDTVTFRTVGSIPVTSVAPEHELGSFAFGDASLNRFVQNVYWGMLSNYLSVPTDCPQRNERLGWMADTQVFADAGAYIADTRAFFRKWMRDVRDTQSPTGAYPGVSPWAQYGAEPTDMMRLGWADAGVIVPWKIWRQFGDRKIVDESWESMEKFVDHVAETKYDHDAIAKECNNYQWADWLSWEKLESCDGGGRPDYSAFVRVNGRGQARPEAIEYWKFLGACYWALDARMMRDMAKGTGRDAAKYEKMLADATAYLRQRFFNTPDGTIVPVFADMQTPAVFTLHLGLVEGEAKAKTVAALRANLEKNGNLTGFLGSSLIMDTLVENGLSDIAVNILLNHKFPSWLYSVDQGATTIWERWNGWTVEKGFGPVGMNSYNHYAYGAVLAWMYRSLAGIAPDVDAPGFTHIVMAPKADRRLGSVKAEYKSAAGLIKSSWIYENDGTWTWHFEIPEGATATVTIPGETASKTYESGPHTPTKRLP